MKRFFTALCALCLTAIFASADEPELIERPLTWKIDSIQIVWNIAEQQFENYELRATTDKVNNSSVGNSQISRNKDTTEDVTHGNISGNIEASISGGIGFSIEKIKKWGLEGSAGLKAGLGRQHEKNTENIQQNEWVKSNKASSQLTVTEDATLNNQTLQRNRKLLFTVNFKNHSKENLLFAPDSANTIPIFCEGEQLGDAEPLNKSFRIPGGTGRAYPCQFVMDLDDSNKVNKLLRSEPDIRILDSQIKICQEDDITFNAFTQSFKTFPHFIVRLTADGASREWEFRYDKKNKYNLLTVLKAIKEEELFEFNEDGSIRSVAGYKVNLSKKPKAFILFAWNGKPVADLKDLQPRKNSVLDVILVSRALLETRQSDTLTALVPFKETLEKWAKEGRFDGKYLEWNLMDKKDRLAEIYRLAEDGDTEMQSELERLRKKAGERKVLMVDGIEYAFRWCPPGDFMMGGLNYNETPVHKVKLTKGFWLLETEVTQEMWQSVMGESIVNKAMQGSLSNKDLCGIGTNYPMYYVSWNDCQSFCQKLSQKLGQQVQLPTEAQWEYACRADTTDYLAGDLDSMGWFNSNSGGRTHEVRQKQPNSWGLYDMYGNVWEWCSDYYHPDYYAKSPTSDPENTTVSPGHVNRGGCWFNNADYCRPSSRYSSTSDYRYNLLGLRVLLVPSSEE